MSRRQFYPASISRDGEGHYCVRLRDLPEIASVAPTLDEAIDRAAEFLEHTIKTRSKDGTPLPPPTALRSNELLI